MRCQISRALARLVVGTSDDLHQDALDKTGFWGETGAGCLLLEETTKTFCLSHRSSEVQEPGTWGTWGGAIDQGESPERAVRREIKEETGYMKKVRLLPLMVFTKGSFRYHNFLALVPKQFVPDLNWESQDYTWCKWGKWPKPLHKGLRKLLADPVSISTIRKFL